VGEVQHLVDMKGCLAAKKQVERFLLI